jgi:DNA modification methylase
MIINDDCVRAMAQLGTNCVDAIVTDPPYELGFMGKSWDASGVAFDPETWRRAFEVLKPGGYLLAFSGSRTYHRMVCAIEDAGFEIRDQVMWVYGSGFPKSLDVSKAIDAAAGARREVVGAVVNRAGDGTTYGLNHSGNLTSNDPLTAAAAAQWQGWGTALKPAHEPICVARKPLIGTVAANVLAWGTGALNIDGCRVENPDYDPNAVQRSQTAQAGYTVSLNVPGHEQPTYNALGRWPANLIHDGSDEVLAAFPQAPGQLADESTGDSPKTSGIYGAMRRQGEPSARRLDDGSAARFFYCAKASKADRNRGCEDLPLRPSGMVSNTSGQHITRRDGGAPSPTANHHPTVKPTELMRYLCRLVTPPGGLVLDPFAGSGSTGVACALEGFQFIGIEREAAYVDIARARIKAAQ